MKQLHIDELTVGQEVIAQYHAPGSPVSEEAVRFVSADLDSPLMATANFLREDDDGVWVPFMVHRFAGEWAYAPHMRRFTLREQVCWTAAAFAEWLDDADPEAALAWLRARLGDNLAGTDLISEREENRLEAEFVAAREVLR